jgi:hypothetical protein
MKSARLALALAVGLVAAVTGYFALVAPRPADKVADDMSAVERPCLARIADHQKPLHLTWLLWSSQQYGRALACEIGERTPAKIAIIRTNLTIPTFSFLSGRIALALVA